MRQKVSSVVWWASLMGVLIAGVFGYYLWRQHNWSPNIQVGVVQSLLVGIIQAQAGILAIALSFSLLYVQISVDTYSLRAAQLLVRHGAFRRMTRYYVLSLVLNSIMALFVTATPEFLPLLVGAIGVAVFVLSLAVMVTYIADVAHFITPEAIINELKREIRYEYFAEEALKITKSRHDLWDEFNIKMPIGVSEQASISGELRILIDIAKRMVRRSDHVAVKAAIDGIVDLGRPKSLPMPLRSDATREEIEVKQKERELSAGAVLAYRAGALMEVWAAAIQSRDQITTVMLITAMGKILGSNILSNFIARTDVLETAIHEQMFKDTGRLDWLDLRRQIVRLLTDGLDRIKRDDLTSEHLNTGVVFNTLTDMGHVLLREERADFASEREVFQGLSILGRYGAAVCNAFIISNVSLYLRDRAQRGRSDVWRVQGYMSARPMAELVAEMGIRWVRADPPKDYKSFWYLLSEGTEEVVKAYNQVRDPGLDFLPSANFAYLDALERIAIACIETEHWRCFKDTLWRMNQLVTDPRRTPEHAAACFAYVLETASNMSQPKAIDLWIEAIREFLHLDMDVEDEQAFEILLRAAGQAQASGVVASASELEAKLIDLTERLEGAHNECRSSK